MSQISRPFQVVLVGAVAFAALWFIALRPKSPSGSAASAPAAATTPGSSIPLGLGKQVAKANKAKQATEDAERRHGGAVDSGPAPKAPAVKLAAKPAAAPAAKVGSARAPVAAGKALVLLFWDRHNSLDQAVHAEFTGADHHGGRARFVAAPLRDLARYGAITRGVEVLQSPTVIVVGHDGGARALIGYTDRAEIDQAVAQALAGR